MKRIGKKALCCLLIVTVFLCALPYAAADGQTGDVTKDSSIDAVDAMLVLQYHVGLEDCPPEDIPLADTDDSGEIDPVDAMLILQFYVGEITMFPADMDETQKYYAGRDAYYGASDENFIERPEVDLSDTQAIVDEYGEEYAPADVDGYDLTEDGLLNYNRIEREAAQLGKLHKYDNAERITGTLTLGDTTLNYSVPAHVTAYDAVPIDYSIVSNSSYLPLHISATTFEEPERYQDPDANYYDLNLPGKVSLEMTFDGFATGSKVDGKAPIWSADFNDQLGTSYPYYDASDLIQSGTVDSNNEITWFKFSYKNTGDTILDSVGNGAFNFYPYLQKKNDQGVYVNVVPEGQPPTDNRMNRIFDYCYPGETGELWFLFVQDYAANAWDRYRFAQGPGEYRIVIEAQVRNERGQSNWMANYVGGIPAFTYTYDFTVAPGGGITTPNAVQAQDHGVIPRNQWMGVFEEFQSSYHSRKTLSSDPTAPTTGTLYVQPAPWNKTLVLKIMHGDIQEAAMVRIPLDVESDSITIELNPSNDNYTIKDDGTREPLLLTQSMADMRGNMQMGPDAATTIINDLRNMKEAGINFINTTMMYAYANEENDCFKFMMDVARAMGFEVEGYMNYPSISQRTLSFADVATGGQPINGTMNTWGFQNMNEANGILAKYSYRRYGDLYWMRNDGVIPIAGEDTWGWLTPDHDWRFGMATDASITRYQNWLKQLYGSIDVLNQAYDSEYEAFENVDPRLEGVYEYTHEGAYTLIDSTRVFKERSRAVSEFDVYRTLARIENYNTMLETADINGAKILIRYEGSGWLAGGIDPHTTNAHYRQMFYEQRRNAMIPEILAASGTVFGGSNYDSLPLTATETYEMTKHSTELGLTMSKMPMTTHVRDIAINVQYGDDKYIKEYNLADWRMKGAVVDTTLTLFPYLKAMYEGGGVPGVMWQDYHCDGFVTSTQYKELQFYTQKIQEMLATPEGTELATNFEPTDRSDMEGVLATWSYPEAYIQEKLVTTPRICVFDPPASSN